MNEEKVYHFVYKTTNLINQKIYIGKHSTTDLNDGYLGSGQHLNNSIKKHGKENFKREILKQFETEQEAYDYEAELVTQEFVLREDNYNHMLGGKGLKANTTFVVNDEGEIISIPSSLMKEFKQKGWRSLTKDTVLIIDNNIIKRITKRDFYSRNDVIKLSEATRAVRDKEGNKIRVSVQEYEEREDLIYCNKGSKHSEEANRRKSQRQKGRQSNLGHHWKLSERQIKEKSKRLKGRLPESHQHLIGKRILINPKGTVYCINESLLAFCELQGISYNMIVHHFNKGRIKKHHLQRSNITQNTVGWEALKQEEEIV